MPCSIGVTDREKQIVNSDESQPRGHRIQGQEEDVNLHTFCLVYALLLYWGGVRLSFTKVLCEISGRQSEGLVAEVCTMYGARPAGIVMGCKDEDEYEQ